MLKKIFGAFGTTVHNNRLMVLSIEPFSQIHPHQFWGALLTPHPPVESPTAPAGNTIGSYTLSAFCLGPPPNAYFPCTPTAALSSIVHQTPPSGVHPAQSALGKGCAGTCRLFGPRMREVRLHVAHKLGLFFRGGGGAHWGHKSDEGCHLDQTSSSNGQESAVRHHNLSQTCSKGQGGLRVRANNFPAMTAHLLWRAPI